MKALSIRQPWAYLIMCGAKHIETRKWAPPRRWIGMEFLVHASKRVDVRMHAVLNQLHMQRHGPLGEMTGFPTIQWLETGALLGKARLVDIREYKTPEEFHRDDDQHLCFRGYFEPVRYGLVLEVEDDFDNGGIPYPGSLGFFDVPEDALCEGGSS